MDLPQPAKILRRGSTAQQHQDAEVFAARIEAFRPVAIEMGVPAELLADPHRRQELEARAFEMAKLMLEPHNRALLLRNPELLESVRLFLGQVTPSAMTPPDRHLRVIAEQRVAPGGGSRGHGRTAGTARRRPSRRRG